jgi:hypothetical protein
MPTNSKPGHQVREALYANPCQKNWFVAVYKDVQHRRLL